MQASDMHNSIGRELDVLKSQLARQVCYILLAQPQTQTRLTSAAINSFCHSVADVSFRLRLATRCGCALASVYSRPLSGHKHSAPCQGLDNPLILCRA